jgi:sulfide dehydrogenase cytochrome subunit
MRRIRLPALASALLLAGLAGSSMAGSSASAQSLAGPPGASSCTGCHASSKVADPAIPRIAGRSANDIAKALREYRGGTLQSSVMGRIAKGFDEQQIDTLAAWFAKQPE